MEKHAGRGGPESWLNPDLFVFGGDETSWPFQEEAQPGVTMATGRQPEAMTDQSISSKLLNTRVAVSAAYYGLVWFSHSGDPDAGSACADFRTPL